MDFVSTEFSPSRSFGDQVDGEEDGLEHKEVYDVPVVVSVFLSSGETVRVSLDSSCAESVLRLSEAVRVEAHTTTAASLGVAGQLCTASAALPSSLCAPAFVTGAAARLLLWCELANVPCKLLVKEPPQSATAASSMYI